MSIVEVKGLYKKFKNIGAIKNLNLTVNKGEIFGLIGPDGAGKTTFLRLLTGVLLADAGTIKCCEVDVINNAEAVKEKIGVMPQNFSLYADLTVEENLNFFAKMYRVEKSECMVRQEKLLQIAKLKPFLKRRAEHLSGGMQKKLALISTLLHKPDLLLLDEPTTGVDPVSRRELWDFFYELLKSGVTLIVSTPYMDEAERCSSVGFLYQGELLFVDQPIKLKSDYPYAIIEISGSDKNKIVISQLAPGLKIIDLYPIANTVHLIIEKGAVKYLQEFFDRHKWSIVMKDIEPSFDDVFVSIIRRQDEKH